MKTFPPKSNRRKDQNQVSLLQVFREANQAKDAQKSETIVEDGENRLSSRAVQRRMGASQEKLKEHLSIDLANLMNTIRLEAVTDLRQHSYTAKSILNYGMDDMANMSSDIANRTSLIRRLRKALIHHEPRLIAETVEVVIREQDHELTQKICFDVQAEMAANPVDVPLAFIAEVDIGAGKVNLAELKVIR